MIWNIGYVRHYIEKKFTDYKMKYIVPNYLPKYIYIYSFK